jgi:hypothetical protein
MKQIKLVGKYLLAAAIVASVNTSCTDLTEKAYGEITPAEKAILDKNLTLDQVNTAVKGAYEVLAGAGFAGHNGVWSDQEVSSDELMIPTRGGDWYDGGQWLRMHQHAYAPAEQSFQNGWNSLYGGIATCNRLIVQIPLSQTAAVAAPLINEVRAVRALFYANLCDMFGGVPLITKYPGDIAEAVGKTRTEVYNFVESELTAVLPSLSKNVDATTYGRINYWAAKGILAKLYLNAQVYTGTAQWDKCISATDEILISNKYMLDANQLTTFGSANENSKENIFVIPFDETKLKGENFCQMTLHYASQATFNLQAQPWNGYCSVADFYNSFDATDKRKAANFLAGPQFAADGTTRLLDNDAEANDPDGKPLTFTAAVNELSPNCLRQAGVRFNKFTPRLGGGQDMQNDFPLVRLGDVLLMGAEARHRKTAGDPAALALVNQIRVRAGLTALAALTDANLYDERSKEMFGEGVHRTDMIRFGKYLPPFGPNSFKTSNDDPSKAIFPIPQSQIDANKALVQNKGY